MTLLQKFSVICLAVFCVFGYALNRIIAEGLERFMIRESIETTASIVEEEVLHEFTASDFRSSKAGEAYGPFSERIRHLTLGRNIERIKIWGKDGTILWSDDSGLVGRKFSDNEEFEDAMTGRVVSEVSSLGKLENIAEQGHGRLLELYVPVTFDPAGGVGAVIEVYRNIGDLAAAVTRMKDLVWKAMAAGLSLLYMALFGLVWGASRRIDRQTREIVRSRERYGSLISSAHDGIICFGRDERIVLCNSAAEKMFGVAPDRLSGTAVTELIGGEGRGLFRTNTAACVQGRGASGCGEPFEVAGVGPDGRAFPVEISLTASGTADELLVTGFIRDISERKAMQEQLIASEKMATISVIAGSIGHEIKNILSSLLGYSELLLARDNNDELTARCAEVFSSQTERLNLHANNLLSLGKPQQPEIREIALHAFLDRVTDLLSASGLLKLCTVLKKYSPDDLVIAGDEMLLEQVIRNLEINALHAMERQGILTLATQVSQDGRFAEISVTDTGHGIKESHRHQIFLPFYTTKEKGKGTGLGLYIVKQIVEQHSGYVKIESEEGRGTTALIGIPIRRT